MPASTTSLRSSNTSCRSSLRANNSARVSACALNTILELDKPFDERESSKIAVIIVVLPTLRAPSMHILSCMCVLDNSLKSIVLSVFSNQFIEVTLKLLSSQASSIRAAQVFHSVAVSCTCSPFTINSCQIVLAFSQ